MNDRPNPWQDVAAFMLKPAWYTPVFWLLLIASVIIAVMAWRRDPLQRSPRFVGIWLLRVLTGCLWWEQSLWKIPFDYAGLIYWMKQQVAHAAIPLQGTLVEQYVLPNINVVRATGLRVGNGDRRLADPRGAEPTGRAHGAGHGG